MGILDVKNLRYIVFLIDSRVKQHDGYIFSSHKEAEDYANDAIKEKYSSKAVIGLFHIDLHCQEMMITKVDTIGFVGDKKKAHQLDLFQ